MCNRDLVTLILVPGPCHSEREHFESRVPRNYEKDTILLQEMTKGCTKPPVTWEHQLLDTSTLRSHRPRCLVTESTEHKLRLLSD